MVTFFFILAFIIVNGLAILLFYRFFKRVSFIFLFFVSLLELTTIYFIAELFNQFDIYLSKKGIFIELGHSKILLLEMLFISLIVAVISIIISVIKKYKSHTSK